MRLNSNHAVTKPQGPASNSGAIVCGTASWDAKRRGLLGKG